MDEPLTAKDRCDHADCDAQARGRATLENDFPLLFCRHHMLRLKPALKRMGARFYEQYDELFQKPGASA